MITGYKLKYLICDFLRKIPFVNIVRNLLRYNFKTQAIVTTTYLEFKTRKKNFH